jgi:hypothetical protein
MPVSRVHDESIAPHMFTAAITIQQRRLRHA